MKKILVVDDEQVIRDLLKKKLEQNNFLASVASSGEEALVLAKSDKPDLVLLDIAMPGMDGYATCEKLKQDKGTESIPVLFLTAKDLESRQMSERYVRVGAAGYLPKPSSFTDLLKKIHELIGN